MHSFYSIEFTQLLYFWGKSSLLDKWQAARLMGWYDPCTAVRVCQEAGVRGTVSLLVLCIKWNSVFWSVFSLPLTCGHKASGQWPKEWASGYKWLRVWGLTLRDWVRDLVIQKDFDIVVAPSHWQEVVQASLWSLCQV